MRTAALQAVEQLKSLAVAAKKPGIDHIGLGTLFTLFNLVLISANGGEKSPGEAMQMATRNCGFAETLER